MRNENSASEREQRMLAFYAEREQNRRSQMRRYWKAEGFVCICGLLTIDKLCVCRPLVQPCRQIQAVCL